MGQMEILVVLGLLVIIHLAQFILSVVQFLAYKKNQEENHYFQRRHNDLHDTERDLVNDGFASVNNKISVLAKMVDNLDKEDLANIKETELYRLELAKINQTTMKEQLELMEMETKKIELAGKLKDKENMRLELLARMKGDELSKREENPGT